MKTLSELFEEWSNLWVKERQDELYPLVEKVIREQLGLGDEFEIVWHPHGLNGTPMSDSYDNCY